MQLQQLQQRFGSGRCYSPYPAHSRRLGIPVKPMFGRPLRLHLGKDPLEGRVC